MDGITFVTTVEFKEITGESEVTQWRQRRAGVLEFYRLAGKIKYSPEQVQKYLETRRVGKRPNAAAMPAGAGV